MAKQARSDSQVQPPGRPDAGPDIPGQVVVVFQGGGALGAYQAGVYQALHDAKIEPDWVIGTSIGAINGVIVAGNPPKDRLARLNQFWESVSGRGSACAGWMQNLDEGLRNLAIVTQGIPSFFAPRLEPWLGLHTRVGVERAAFYSTEPLRATLSSLVDFDYLNNNHMRLTVGTVNVKSGRMRYFTNRDAPLDVDHVMASAAFPPGFPSVRLDGETYWDGGIYSNTPIEVVMNDNPRHDAIIFAAELWQQESLDPDSILEVMGRQKDIQYASQAESHTKRQQEIHHLRHIVRELGKLLPDDVRSRSETRELLSWGCGTLMHVVPLRVPAVKGEDHTKDIDFTPAGVRARWDPGREQTRRVIAQAPWNAAIDPAIGIVVHE